MLTRARCGAPRFHARLTGVGNVVVERGGALNPYAAGILVEDARALSSGARLEISVTATAADATLRDLHRMLCGLPHVDVEITARRAECGTSCALGVTYRAPARTRRTHGGGSS